MSKTVSGHEAIKSWGSPLLAARVIPGTQISLRTRRCCLPLFLNLAHRLDTEIAPLSKRNTWSYNYRAIRTGQAVSDHAGYAIDCWSDGIGAFTWPSKMPAVKARKISKLLEEYRTDDGRYIFLWGASLLAPGVVFKGQTHKSKTGNDPMHFAIAADMTMKDVANVISRMGIKADGSLR